MTTTSSRTGTTTTVELARLLVPLAFYQHVAPNGELEQRYQEAMNQVDV